jgi:heme/copper-type cytochrome/quinol oxidase subunit 2
MPVVAAAEMQTAQQPLQLPVGLLLYAVFMALALSTVLAPIVIVVWRPQRSRQRPPRARDWLDRNGGTTAAIVTIVFGAVFVIRGTVALLS